MKSEIYFEIIGKVEGKKEFKIGACDYTEKQAKAEVVKLRGMNPKATYKLNKVIVKVTRQEISV